MRRILTAILIGVCCAAPAQATGPFNVFVNDSFQRAATTSPTVTGPSSDVPIQTDPFSTPSTGAAYVAGGSVTANIDSSHILHCKQISNNFTDGVYAPANETLLNQAAQATWSGGVATLTGGLRLRCTNGNLYNYQCQFTASGIAFYATTGAGNVSAGALTYAGGVTTGYTTTPVVGRFHAEGSNPTTLTAWIADPATPNTPIAGSLYTSTDSTAALQSAGGYGIYSSLNTITNWQRANTSQAPVVATLMPQIAGTTTTCKFAVPSVTLGQSPYTYAWESSPPGATFTWTTVAGATTSQPTFTLSQPTLFRVTVTDAASLASTPAIYLGQPWKAPLKVCVMGDSITNFGGFGRASYNTPGLPDGSNTLTNAVVLEQAQAIIGPRNLTIIGMGVGGTASKDWISPSAAWNPGTGSEATNLYTQLDTALTTYGFGSGDIVSIELGMNDCFVDDVPTFTANILSIVTALKAAHPGIIVVLQRPTCSSTVGNLGQTRPLLLQQFGSAIASLANPAGGIYAAGPESYDYFARHPDQIQSDGVHPIGYSTSTTPYQTLNTIRFKAMRDALDGVGSSIGGYRRRMQY